MTGQNEVYYNFLIKLLKRKILMSRFDYTWRYVYLKVCSNIIRHLVCIPRSNLLESIPLVLFTAKYRWRGATKLHESDSNFASNHPSRQNELDNKRRDVYSCNLRRLWNNNLEEREERSGNQRAGPPLSKVRNDFFFFFYHEEGRGKKEEEKGGRVYTTGWRRTSPGNAMDWIFKRHSIRVENRTLFLH